MENPIDSQQPSLGLGVDPVVGLVVVLERAALEDVIGVADVGEGQFRETREVHLLDHRPCVLDLRGRAGRRTS
jgi:hypothetical protein